METRIAGKKGDKPPLSDTCTSTVIWLIKEQCKKTTPLQLYLYTNCIQTYAEESSDGSYMPAILTCTSAYKDHSHTSNMNWSMNNARRPHTRTNCTQIYAEESSDNNYITAIFTSSYKDHLYNDHKNLAFASNLGKSGFVWSKRKSNWNALQRVTIF